MIFLGLLKFKMAAADQLAIIADAKTEVKNYSNFIITFPIIWRCVDDFFNI